MNWQFGQVVLLTKQINNKGSSEVCLCFFFFDKGLSVFM
jgi:hypothetical protein